MKSTTTLWARSITRYRLRRTWRSEVRDSRYLVTGSSTSWCQVLSVLTWHYMDAGNYQFAAAVGVLQTVLMLALVIGTRAVFNVGLERALGRGG